MVSDFAPSPDMVEPDGSAPIPPSSRPSLRARAVALAQVLLCSDVPTQLALALVLGLAGWFPTDATGALSLRYVVALSLADVVLLIFLMVVCLRASGESPAALWLGRRPMKREVLLGLLLVPAVFVAVAILLSAARLLAPGLHNVVDNPLEQLARTPMQAALLALVVILAGGLREELQRAFLLHRFEHYLGGTWVGLAVVSVAFGLGHQLQGWDAVIATGALGAIWGLVYIRRRSSVAAVVSHAGFNALQIVAAVATGSMAAG
jgi:membrane protease YdiL (CAAX protease family)